MSLKSGMQMFNLALSIMNKVHTMQHRQIKIAKELRKGQPLVTTPTALSTVSLDTQNSN
jgi:hypothetical protein